MKLLISLCILLFIIINNVKSDSIISSGDKCKLDNNSIERLLLRVLMYDNVSKNNKIPEVQKKTNYKIQVSATCRFKLEKYITAPASGVGSKFDPDAFVASSIDSNTNELIILAFFRATEPTWTDWKANLKVLPKTCKIINDGCGKIHSGFRKLYDIVREPTMKVVDELSKGHKSIRYVVVGHSQGAALSTLFSLEIANKFKPKYLEVRTIGSPRVGNKEFRDIYNKLVPNTKRYVNDIYTCDKNNKLKLTGQDIVTNGPPKLMSYRHVGNEVKVICPKCTKCPCKENEKLKSNIKLKVGLCHGAKAYKTAIFRHFNKNANKYL